ncbi:uncharacterized protein LOC129592579 [Paramacrobiotus metropolitanus]|uniref:uncharacterized protein LOC129592579 n=1 Tax=Paramacrobiotus metropolitanus TaxID=2943436 RepID=UPI0024462DF6|nr:uncharacterized protein LOC129592579 [Paramacrobiotus metropolitanus]
MFSFCLITAVCIYSTEQGQRLREVADICLSIGEKNWKRDEWNAVFVRSKTNGPGCFTLAGVVITRESAMQAWAALVSALLVFAELARSSKNAELDLGAINTTQIR